MGNRQLKNITASLLVLLLLPSARLSAEIMPPLAAELQSADPVSLLSDDFAKDFVFRDDSPKDKPASLAVIGELEGKPLFSANVQVGSKNAYSVEARWTVSRSIKKGDVVLARFAARARKAKQESGEAAVSFVFQLAREPWDKCVSEALNIAPEWTVYNVPFVVSRDFEKGEAASYLNFGAIEQTVEITGLQVLDFQNRVPIEKLPVNRFSYTGREDGASWRTEALKRIEKIRTAPITFKAVDAAGKPVKNVKIDAEMTRSAFEFGSEVDADFLQEKSADAQHYRKSVTELFNTVTIGNGLKWGRWLNPSQRKNTVASLDWLNSQNLRVRGHNLVWPGWHFTPKKVVDDPDRDSKLEGLIEDRIREMTAATRGKVICWDVINEPIHETDYFKTIPQETMVKWLDLAHAGDPDAKLVVNEYGMLNGSGSMTMVKKFLDLTQFLKQKGAKIDGLGVQGHLGAQQRSPVLVLSDLDQLSTSGLPIEITEFDISTHDEQLQADYTRDFLIACYSHSSVKGFIMWGFYEPKHWRPSAAMFRPDWSEKPNAKVWRDLVLNQWKTKISSMADASGQLNSRGHLGDYQVTATADGKSCEVHFTLQSAGETVELMLK